MTTDVAIVGCGAAGLYAARALGRAGRSVIVLEARNRAGGRIHSAIDERSPVPIEFGPEFVHGRPAITLSLMKEFGGLCVDDDGASFEVDGAGALRESSDDPFERARNVLQAGSSASPDESVETFLARHANVSDASDIHLAARLVAGFDAADPARASAREIADEWRSDAAAGGMQSRPVNGYAPLVAHLVRTLDRTRVRLRFGATVRSIVWNEAGIELTATLRGEAQVIRARHVIVTVPIGVLQRVDESPGMIHFDPPLPRAVTDAIARIAMGPVVKVIMRFRTPFWESVQQNRFRDAAFFATNAAFPTYWTQLPQRAPLLTAWAGGPVADALGVLDRDTIVARALSGTGTLFDAAALAEDECEATYFHDWQRDPFACGAYSYVVAGGEGARARLCEPIADGALLFAGEATAQDGEGGTVAGALQSGERAARAIAAR